MDSKVTDIRPVVMENLVIPEYYGKEGHAVQPVKKGEGAQFSKVDRRVETDRGKEAPVLDKEKIEAFIESAREFLADQNITLNFEISDRTGDMVIKIIDEENKEVIRQIPPEEILRLREHLEELRGALFSEKV